MLGYHVPNNQHADAAALAVLAGILTGGRTARLTQRLVVQGHSAASIFAYQGPGSRYPRLFIFQAVPIAPHTTQEIESAIYDELERIQREPPTETEMQRVRNSIDAGEVGRLENPLGLALQIANSEALWSDWQFTFRFSDAERRVTPADVQRVARTYFSRSNRTVATLVRPQATGRQASEE